MHLLKVLDIQSFFFFTLKGTMSQERSVGKELLAAPASTRNADQEKNCL
jgi:hypothetical protein